MGWCKAWPSFSFFIHFYHCCSASHIRSTLIMPHSYSLVQELQRAQLASQRYGLRRGSRIPITLLLPSLSLFIVHTQPFSSRSCACTTQVQDADPIEDAQRSSGSATAVLNYTASPQENAPVSSAWTEVELAIDEADDSDNEPQEEGHLRGRVSRAELQSERTTTITSSTTHSFRSLEDSSSERSLPSLKNPLSRILNSISIAFSSSDSSSSSSSSSYSPVRTDAGSEAEEGRAQPSSESNSGQLPSANAPLSSNSTSERRVRPPPTTDGVFANLSAKPEVEGQKDNQQRPPVNKKGKKMTICPSIFFARRCCVFNP